MFRKPDCKKIILRAAASLMAALFLMLLCACAEIRITHPLGKNKLLEINDVSCTMGTAVARMLEAVTEYENAEDAVLWSRIIGNKTLARYVKDTVEDEMKKYTAAQVMSKELTVFITDEERRAADENADRLLKELNSRYDMSEYDISYSDVVDLYIKRTYYNKVYEKLSEDIYMEISEADTKAIEISYVFIPATDSVETAEKMRNEILGGGDFSDVCRRYGYTPVLNITQTRGSMSAAFDSTAFALRDNETSEILETRDGYYIIYCMEDYMVAESIANKNRVISEGKRERFRIAYEAFAKKATLRFNTAEWEKIEISSFD